MKSWKDASGRKKGGDEYVFGDIFRTTINTIASQVTGDESKPFQPRVKSKKITDPDYTSGNASQHKHSPSRHLPNPSNPPPKDALEVVAMSTSKSLEGLLLR